MEKRFLKYVVVLLVLLFIIVAIFTIRQIEFDRGGAPQITAFVVVNNVETAKLIPLKVEDISGVARVDEPVEGQVPFGKGFVTNINQLSVLRLNAGQYELVPAQFLASTTHADSSINLIRYHFRLPVSLPANAAHTYYLYYGSTGGASASVPSPLNLNNIGGEDVLSTTNSDGQIVSITIDPSKFSIAKRVNVGGVDIWPLDASRGFYVESETGSIFNSLSPPTSMNWVWTGPLTSVLNVQGSISGTPLTYSAYIQFYAGTSRIDVKSIIFMHRGPRNLVVSAQYYFKRLFFQSVVGDLTGTQTLQTDYASIPYTNQVVQVIQDGTPGGIDDYTTSTAPEPTTANSLDNLYHKVRVDGSLAPVSGTQGNGLLSYYNSQQRYSSFFKDFWQNSAKLITFSRTGSINNYVLDLWPKQNLYNDLTHTIGAKHGVSSSNNLIYNNYGSGVPSSQSTNNYVFESGAGKTYTFGFNFDYNLPMPANDYAKAYQYPLLGLPPKDYWKAFLPMYVESRDWTQEASLSSSTRSAAMVVDRWGKAIWDTSVLTNCGLPQCITMLQRLERGGMNVNTEGRFMYTWGIYGNQLWGTVQNDQDSYGWTEGSVLAALRNQDVEGVTRAPVGFFRDIAWYWATPGQAMFGTGGYRYQSGDQVFGSYGASPRHSPSFGKWLWQIITGDWQAKDTLLITSARFTGDGIPGWQQEIQQTGFGGDHGKVGHYGKDLQGLAAAYDATGNPARLQTGMQLLQTALNYAADCKARYGVNLIVYDNNNDVSNCGLQYTGSTTVSGTTYQYQHSEMQLFMIGYLWRGGAEILSRYKSHFGSTDPLYISVHSMFVNTMNEFFTGSVQPFISSQSGVSLPQDYAIVRITSGPLGTPPIELLNAVCSNNPASGSANSNPIANSGTLGTSYFFTCSGLGASNAINLVSGLGYLYQETGDLAVKAAIEDIFNDVFNSGTWSQVSYHNSQYVTIVKEASTFMYEAPRGLAALVGSSCSPNGLQQSCSTGQPGICAQGSRTCTNGLWSICTSSNSPIVEICSNTLDDDCDGVVNDGCTCSSWAGAAVCSATNICSGQLVTQAAQPNCCIGSCQTPVIPTGLIAAYSFEEGAGATTTADVSGNNNQGTLINGPQSIQQGRYGHGLSFDGVNDYISVPNSANLNPTNELTITAWVRNPSNGDMLISKGISAGQYQLRFVSPGIRYNINGNVGPTNAYSFIPDTWHHVAGIFDGNSDTMKIYVDGILVDPVSTSITTTIQASTVELNIGRRSQPSAGTENYLFGDVDEVRLYNRALSLNEILFDMNLPIQQGSSFCGNNLVEPGEQCGEPSLPQCSNGFVCSSCVCAANPAPTAPTNLQATVN